SACTGIGLVTTAWLLAGGPFGRGYALAATALMLHKLRPKRAPLSTSTGWLLFRLPRMPEPQRTEFRAGPIAAAANDALQEGDLDTAQRHVDQLTEQYPHLTATRSAQVAMLEAAANTPEPPCTCSTTCPAAPTRRRGRCPTCLPGLPDRAFAAPEPGPRPGPHPPPPSRPARSPRRIRPSHPAPARLPVQRPRPAAAGDVLPAGRAGRTGLRRRRNRAAARRNHPAHRQEGPHRRHPAR